MGDNLNKLLRNINKTVKICQVRPITRLIMHIVGGTHVKQYDNLKTLLKGDGSGRVQR